MSSKTDKSKALATLLAKAAEERKATDITVMNLTQIDFRPVEYFVICTCASEPQMKAVVDEVEKRCIEIGLKRPRIEGFGKSHWILLDFFDVVMHVMIKDSREFYKIEKLWNDAEFFTLSENNRLIKKK